MNEAPETADESLAMLATWRRLNDELAAERDRLFAAAKRLGAEITQIAAAAGVTRPTVYAAIERQEKAMKAAHISTNATVIYTGDLPEEGWGNTGRVIAIEPDASGDAIVTVDFNGHHQDIPASDLELDPMDAADHWDGDDCTA